MITELVEPSFQLQVISLSWKVSSKKIELNLEVQFIQNKGVT